MTQSYPGILSPSASATCSLPSTGLVIMSSVTKDPMFSSANVFIYCFVGRQFKDTLNIILRSWTPSDWTQKVESEQCYHKTDENPAIETEIVSIGV